MHEQIRSFSFQVTLLTFHKSLIKILRHSFVLFRIKIYALFCLLWQYTTPEQRSRLAFVVTVITYIGFKVGEI